MPAARSSSVPATDPVSRAAIVAAARTYFFTHGYSALTMDHLAADLGISKKTLYVHFAGKDALVAEILDEFAAQVRGMAEALFADTTLNHTAKFRKFVEAMSERFARIGPHVLRDLQRSAPGLFRKVEELRYTNIPKVFDRIIREGQAAGTVRSELDPALAIEFWRPAIQNLMHPDTLDRLRLKPHQAFEEAINLFFGGVLTPAGRKDYEKQFPR